MANCGAGPGRCKIACTALTPAVAVGPDYTIKDPVVADSYMYRFTVASAKA